MLKMNPSELDLIKLFDDIAKKFESPRMKVGISVANVMMNVARFIGFFGLWPHSIILLN